MAAKYRLIYVGADCKPFLGEPIDSKDIAGSLDAGVGHIAGLVCVEDWCDVTVNRDEQYVDLDLSKYGKSLEER